MQGCEKFATSTLFSFPLQKVYQNASYWNHNFETTLIYKNNIYFANFSTSTFIDNKIYARYQRTDTMIV